jgi:hypothetical protein
MATTTATQQPTRTRKRTTNAQVGAGVGGMVFVATLVVQNVLRSKAPGFGAAPAPVAAYFAHNRAAVLIPLGLFPLGMVALTAFVAGVWTVTDPDHKQWAHLGALGATAIMALFAVVNISEIALAAKASALAASPAVVQALWAIHAGAFGLDLAAIAVTLIGLSRAARSSRLIGPWAAAAALPGAACFLIAATFTVALANGGPWIAVGLIGFIAWLIFVIDASINLLRHPR